MNIINPLLNEIIERLNKKLAQNYEHGDNNHRRYSNDVELYLYDAFLSNLFLPHI